MRVSSLDQSEEQKRAGRYGVQMQAVKVGWRCQGGQVGRWAGWRRFVRLAYLVLVVWCGVSKTWQGGLGAAARIEERAALPALGVDFLIRQILREPLSTKCTNLSRCHSPHARRQSSYSDTTLLYWIVSRTSSPPRPSHAHSSSRKQVSVVYAQSVTRRSHAWLSKFRRRSIVRSGLSRLSRS